MMTIYAKLARCSSAIEIKRMLRRTGHAVVPIEPTDAGRVAAEREACAELAEAIDSGRGNEKEIARAIRARS